MGGDVVNEIEHAVDRLPPVECHGDWLVSHGALARLYVCCGLGRTLCRRLEKIRKWLRDVIDFDVELRVIQERHLRCHAQFVYDALVMLGRVGGEGSQVLRCKFVELEALLERVGEMESGRESGR